MAQPLAIVLLVVAAGLLSALVAVRLDRRRREAEVVTRLSLPEPPAVTLPGVTAAAYAHPGAAGADELPEEDTLDRGVRAAATSGRRRRPADEDEEDVADRATVLYAEQNWRAYLEDLDQR